MNKKIVIDLSNLRDCSPAHPCDKVQPAGVVFDLHGADGLKTIRELAVFQYTCRRCEDAPCVEVCPCDALEKDVSGMITRALNLCIACKSCVTICPFGTMMSDFFQFKLQCDQYLDLEDEKDLRKFVKESPGEAVRITDEDLTKEQHVFELTKNIYIREIPWEELKEAE